MCFKCQNKQSRCTGFHWDSNNIKNAHNLLLLSSFICWHSSDFWTNYIDNFTFLIGLLSTLLCCKTIVLIFVSLGFHFKKLPKQVEASANNLTWFNNTSEKWTQAPGNQVSEGGNWLHLCRISLECHNCLVLANFCCNRGWVILPVFWWEMSWTLHTGGIASSSDSCW